MHRLAVASLVVVAFLLFAGASLLLGWGRAARPELGEVVAPATSVQPGGEQAATSAPTTAAPTTTTTAPPPPVVWPASPLADPVDPADVRSSITPAKLSEQTWGQTQTGGLNLQVGEVPDEGVSVDGALRFGAVPDPLGSGNDVLLYRSGADDPVTVGGIRTETAHYTLPYDQEFWQVTRLMHESWAGTDDQQIVFQWHDGDFSENGPGAPILAFYVKGEQLRIVARSDASSPPSRDSLTNIDLLTEQATPYAGRWQDVVINARLSPFPEDEPFLRIWRNGSLIVDYRGPLAFNQPEYEDFAKLGYYHWLNADNDWDRSIPERSVYVAYMSIFDSPDGRYSFEDASQHLLAGVAPDRPDAQEVRE